MNVQNIKKRIPYPLKQGLKYIYGTIPIPVRYGKVFRETYAFLEESQWWSKERLEEYQMQQLEKLLNHAYENVPYYRRVFEQKGLRSKDIQNSDNLRKLPYLTKDIIRENLPDLVARNYPKSKLHHVTTGGSTGVPMEMYWEKGVINPKEWAFVWRQWNWAGYKYGERRVIMRGNIINIYKDGIRQWWEYLPLDNALILSSYNMTEENLPKYVERINKFKPVVLQGYPSSLYIVANFLQNNNLRLKNIKNIFTSSETLYPHQKEIMEEYFDAKIWDLYGNTERNALVMQCEEKNYHIISEYGIMELIDSKGEKVNKEGELGEIIATGFNNHAMPFIRYKTGDFGVYTKKHCSCGRNYLLLQRIEGRVQDLIVTKDRRLITLTALIFAQHFNAFSRVREIQLIQEREGELFVRIVKNPQYSHNDELEILSKMQMAVTGGLSIKFEYVDHIPRTKRGKHKFLVQKLPVGF